MNPDDDENYDGETNNDSDDNDDGDDDDHYEDNDNRRMTVMMALITLTKMTVLMVPW